MNNNMKYLTYGKKICIKLKNVYGQEIEGNFSICVVHNPHSNVRQFSNNVMELLNDSEKRYICLKKNDRRIESYLLGRIATKYALNHLGTFTYKDIYVVNGVTGRPIIKYQGKNSCFSLSITHTGNIGVAIVFDHEYMFGIDIEKIDVGKCDAIYSQLIGSEKKLVNEYNEKEHILFLMWSAKEALGKYLGIGLSADYKIFKIKQIVKFEYYYIVEFSYFLKHKVWASFYDNCVLTLALYGVVDIGTLERYMSDIFRDCETRLSKELLG